ncbi:MAG: oxaloacetate decarboxylase [Thermoleophilia bacterium]|jgi:2-methylisocitrate lyase-like PEP mutase family enzyme|nr:oxaloacetate decarboxylase [Thermoleophilia bacterium]MBJ7334464.1 oxaloacetate decarboxylase [Thermoleophilia bacterium]
MSLRARLQSGKILVAPGAYDALTARLLEQAGFEAVYRGGYAASAAAFALPDLGITTLTDMVDHARRMTSAITVPVIADADTGYGEVPQVIHTVHELERAGVAAIQFEDQVFPKRCGHMEGKKVIPAEEMVVKVRAALDARRNPETVIIARSDATAVTGLDDAIARSRMYADAGADVIFIDAPTSEDDLKAIAAGGINAVLMVNISEYGKTPDLGAQRFEELGFGLVIYPSSTLFAAAQSTKELAAALMAEGSTVSSVPRMMPFDEINDILGKDEWDSLEDNLRESK